MHVDVYAVDLFMCCFCLTTWSSMAEHILYICYPDHMRTEREQWTVNNAIEPHRASQGVERERDY